MKLVYRVAVPILFINISFAWGAPPSPAGGNYLALDGEDDYAFLDFRTYGLLFNEETNGLTIEAWIYPTSVPDNDAIGTILSQQIVIYTASYKNPRYQDVEKPMHWEEGNLYLGMLVYVPPFGGGLINSYTGIGGMTISPYQWHHIVFQMGEGQRIGICDALAKSGAGAFPVEQNLFKESPGFGKRTRGEFVVGGYGTKTRIAWPFQLWGPFAGYIDELRISKVTRYNVAKRNFASTGRFEPDEHTVALWHFDEPAGADIFLDSSSNRYNLAARNGAATLAVSEQSKLMTFWGAIKTSILSKQ